MSDTETEQGRGSPFWKFSLGFYRRPGMAEACIALQEQCGADVNLLLFLLWQATQRRQASVAEVTALEHKIAPWREATVVPLRAIRRALKNKTTLVEKATAEAFRSRVKAVELEAERLQQEAMYALARSSPPAATMASAEAAARASLAAYGSICRTAFPEAVVATLLIDFENLAASL
jgi:uncharacterized protein (TIGR02444 family)